eukprot:TRINITY_DN1474_c0_g1::TRINITY_DN1474_c0_g1_i1::g.27298::m.27298 TRINITY_DN1474_c0_g1::TRINITY_DN1474_c0_g1_i1::g.27298  ORF type:complete len:149 (-),score=32.58 TRINITY_DN1474_c0_g1_i1:194-607(-)
MSLFATLALSSVFGGVSAWGGGETTATDAASVSGVWYGYTAECMENCCDANNMDVASIQEVTSLNGVCTYDEYDATNYLYICEDSMISDYAECDQTVTPVQYDTNGCTYYGETITSTINGVTQEVYYYVQWSPDFCM